MKPSSVILPAVKRASGRRRPARSSTGPSGAGMIALRAYVPGGGGTKSIVTAAGRRSSGSCGPAPATAAGAAAPARTVRMRASRGSAERRGAVRSIGGLHRLGAELHVVRPAELLLVEVHLERGREGLTGPGGGGD